MINGSGAGIEREGRRRRRAVTAEMPEPLDAPQALVVIDPEEPLEVETPRVYEPIVLPTRPDDPADVERWQRPRDLVSLGECLVEMTRRPDGAFQPSISGDAFNTIFYAARVGMRTGLITAVGDDLFTPMIVERISDEAIDMAHVQRLPGRRNGIYFIEHDDWGERHFHYWRDNSAATETLQHADVDRLATYVSGAHFLLISGITLAVMKEPERLRELLESVHGRTTIVLDANYRPRLWRSVREYQFRIETTLPFVDVFLPSRQDIESAWRGKEPRETLAMASDAGVTTTIMKDGASGCAVYVDGELHALPPVDGFHVVDTTGAGDAFNAGVLGGLLRGTSLEEACDLGQRIAARALMVPGAIDPAFTPHAIDATWRG
jgi:2-dehydro-3-deoxygluconokinase